MPSERHVPLRRCVACRTSLPKERLIRFVEGADGAWRLDAQGRAPGRGTWICTECAHAADPKRIAKAFRGRPDAVIDQLRAHQSGAPARDAHGTSGSTHDPSGATHDRTDSKHERTSPKHARTGSKHDPRPLNSGGNHG